MVREANGRTADHEVEPMFLERWSPRAFTGEPIPEAVLLSLFEAAHWAPSSFNGQPWRFVYAHRGTPAWDPLFGLLIDFNKGWAVNASALIYVVSARDSVGKGGERTPNYSHSFDAGAAWGFLALQAHLLGWAAHGMTGFDHAGAYDVLGVPEDRFRVEAAVAIGRRGDPATLPEGLRAREAPSGRIPLSDLIFEGRASRIS